MAKMPRAACPALIAVLAFLLFAPNANALSLVPIAQDFAPSGRLATQTFRLDNETDKSVAVTVKITTREMSLDGEEANADTKDFLVFPSQAVIGPRQTQVVRVQWKGTGTPNRELAYRIIAEQQAIKAEIGPDARAIQLVVRYVGSVYVVPSGARPNVTLESARAITLQNRKALELVLDNNGRSHTLIDEPVLTIIAGGVTRTFKNEELEELLGENILAQSKRRFVMPWPADLPFEQPKVDFTFSPLR